MSTLTHALLLVVPRPSLPKPSLPRPSLPRPTLLRPSLPTPEVHVHAEFNQCSDSWVIVLTEKKLSDYAENNTASAVPSLPRAVKSYEYWLLKSGKCAVRLFQTRGPGAAKLLSPNVLGVRGTAHDPRPAACHRPGTDYTEVPGWKKTRSEWVYSS